MNILTQRRRYPVASPAIKAAMAVVVSAGLVVPGVGAQASVLTRSAVPAMAAPAPEAAIETVQWRRNRTAAGVAAAIVGLGVLGAAAAAAQPSYGYRDTYGYEPRYREPAYGYGPGYGYEQRRVPGYGYEPGYGRAPAYVYEQPAYAAPRRYRDHEYGSYRAPRRGPVAAPYYHDYGRGYQRGRDLAEGGR